MSRLGAKCPECGYVNPRSLGSYYKGVDDIEEIEETYVCEECQIVFKRTGKVTWDKPKVTTRSCSSAFKKIEDIKSIIKEDKEEHTLDEFGDGVQYIIKKLEKKIGDIASETPENKWDEWTVGRTEAAKEILRVLLEG